MPRARSRSEPPDLPRQDPRRALVVDRGEVADRLDLGCGQPRGGARADTRQHPDRERREERRLAARPDDGQAAWLAAVGGDLRDQLRGRDAERARQPRPRPDDGAHGLGQGARVVERRRDLAEVEIALVDPRLFDGGYDLADDRPHLPRVLAVDRHARANEHGVGQRRSASAHDIADTIAVPPRDVVRRRDHAAAVRVAADDERPPSGARAARAPRPPRRRRRGRGGRRSGSPDERRPGGGAAPARYVSSSAMARASASASAAGSPGSRAASAVRATAERRAATARR